MKQLLLTLLSVLSAATANAVSSGAYDTFTTHLERAYDSYMEGDTSDVAGVREQSFNRALKLYSQLEGEPGNGKLYYNIGNTYFQLGKYGWAILYYLKAQQLIPRDDRVQFHLALAQTEQNIPIQPVRKWKQYLFFWHSLLSQSERVQLFVGLLVLFTALLSFWIWTRRPWVGFFAQVSAVMAALVLSSILYFQYFAPIDAVVIRAYGLYHGPGEDYALVQDEPFIPGTQVAVETVVQEGSWAKVKAPNGYVGYVPSDVIRLVD